MSESALISVIIPIYNTLAYLPDCVESVVGQTYARLDIVLVDDGSTDGCAGVCDDYAARDPRVQVIHQPNGGLAAARNAGLQAAKGEYVVWLDSDDTYEPTTVEKLYDALRRNGVRIAMCNYRNIDVDGSAKARYALDFSEKVYSREEMMAFMLGGAFPATATCSLIARSLYEGIVYPQGGLFEDIRTTWKLHEKADGAVLLAEPLMNRVLRHDGISSNQNIRNRVEGCKAYIARYEEARQRWPRYERAMLVSSARLLRILRKKILRNSLGEYLRCGRDIRAICAFYRRHRREILGPDAPLRLRVEYRLITSGCRAGFVLSRAWVKYTSRGPVETYLTQMETPDLPPF